MGRVKEFREGRGEERRRKKKKTSLFVCFVFFFNDTATTEIYTLSLHDALPISPQSPPLSSSSVFLTENMDSSNNKDATNEMKAAKAPAGMQPPPAGARSEEHTSELQSPVPISYAVFCLKKKKKQTNKPTNGKTNEHNAHSHATHHL